MSKRPLTVTIVGCFFILVGIGSLGHGIWRFVGGMAHAGPPDGVRHQVLDVSLVVVSALLAGAGGAFMLRERNWARWLVLAWMGAHVVLSLLHSPWQVALHGVFFAALLFLLTRAEVSAYFSATRSEST